MNPSPQVCILCPFHHNFMLGCQGEVSNNSKSSQKRETSWLCFESPSPLRTRDKTFGEHRKDKKWLIHPLLVNNSSQHERTHRKLGGRNQNNHAPHIGVRISGGTGTSMNTSCRWWPRKQNESCDPRCSPGKSCALNSLSEQWPSRRGMKKLP